MEDAFVPCFARRETKEESYARVHSRNVPTRTEENAQAKDGDEEKKKRRIDKGQKEKQDKKHERKRRRRGVRDS